MKEFIKISDREWQYEERSSKYHPRGRRIRRTFYKLKKEFPEATVLIDKSFPNAGYGLRTLAKYTINISFNNDADEAFFVLRMSDYKV